MTPTPQSLDTVTEALEAAAKVADGWREIDWPEHVHRSAVAKVAESIASRIRALAIKPTPAGEGDTALMSRALERLRLLRDAPSTDPMEKSANGLTYIIEDLEHRLAHAPAASPVQGVDQGLDAKTLKKLRKMRAACVASSPGAHDESFECQEWLIELDLHSEALLDCAERALDGSREK